IVATDGVYSYGVKLLAGGSVGNSGLIQAGTHGIPSYGVYIVGGAGTLTNSGTVIGLGGVKFSFGYVSNSNTGLISGARLGVYIGSGTIINAGTITGIIFGDGPNLLGLEAGYEIVGGVQGNGASNILELLGSSGGPLTVNYNNLGLQKFQQVLFGTAGHDT